MGAELQDDRLARAPGVLLTQGHWGWEEITWMKDILKILNLECRQLFLGQRLVV